MATKRRAALSLLLLAPAIAELLSGSSPPARFFHPLGFVILLLLYGGGVLLIREARARWGLGWQVVLLAVAFGVLEEGTAIQSFFNPNHEDLHQLSRYGLLLGVQWPWAISVTFYHATMSVLLPLAVVDGLYPEVRDQPLLSRRGLIVAAAGLASSVLFFWLLLWGGQRGAPNLYRADPALVFATAAIVAALVGLARRARGLDLRHALVPLMRPVTLGGLCFLAQGLNVIVPRAMSDNGASAAATVTLQLLGLGLAASLALLQLCHRQLTARHLTAAVIGSMSLFIAFAPIQELGRTDNPDPTSGMAIVGLVALALVLWWRRRTLSAVPRKM